MPVFFLRIATLILKNLRDEFPPEEHVELYAWVNTPSEKQDLFVELTNEGLLRDARQEFYTSDETVWSKIMQGIERAGRAGSQSSPLEICGGRIDYNFTSNRLVV